GEHARRVGPGPAAALQPLIDVPAVDRQVRPRPDQAQVAGPDRPLQVGHADAEAVPPRQLRGRPPERDRLAGAVLRVGPAPGAAPPTAPPPRAPTYTATRCSTAVAASDASCTAVGADRTADQNSTMMPPAAARHAAQTRPSRYAVPSAPGRRSPPPPSLR